ncbi:MAG: tRNA-binding protein [Bacteroidota bacterium]|nr:tRNA-binding protein [Bacteroidota bacterium]MDX5404928.1 tRNA-binding protein [Bacteroidota bacterium]MDX5429082.1 tRNA-binding protein [Bacteroidota bacterium]MDX5447810.1 tRNA-binding protein [Bacteroidota bacterium]MDX5506733.1 tRNA-binding protein [Bacteroidota bacterium]
MSTPLKWEEFERVEIRVGTVLSCQWNEKARKPAYILEIDLGSLGIRRSSAQVTDRYSLDDLIGKQVVAVVNFPPKQIAGMMSECLVLGALEDNGVILLHPGEIVANGTRIG